MKARRVVPLLAVAAATALIASVSTLAQSGPPSVGYFTPQMGPAGTVVMLYGNLPSDTSVYFNGAYAYDKTWISSGQIRVVVPGGASTGPLTVSNSYGTTSPGTFYVTTGTPPPTPTFTTPPPPTPTSTPSPLPPNTVPYVGYYTPQTGPVGTVVMLYGTLPSNTSVYFNSAYASDRTWISSGQMRVVVPQGAWTGPLTVSNSYGTTSPGTFYVPTPTPTPSPEPLTRYSVDSPAGNALLPSVRQGVEVMQSRPVSDPTSWAFQAAVHGYMSGIPQAGWGSCQHRNLHFLSWHRMYLYYFERILRRASGLPTLTLPYWNYTDPAQRALPLSFRSPTVGNALYVSNRSTTMNQGGLLPDSAVSYTDAFAQTTYSNFTLGGLEQQPHNVIHVLIDGWMADPRTAAQDPIFWFHHANIDRLWKRWLDQGGGRANPTADSTWMNTPFTFYDENGTRVTMTGSQVLYTVRQLGYRYDDDTNLLGRVADGGVVDETSAAVAVPAAPAPLQELASLDQVLNVGGAAVQFDVPLPLSANEKLSSVAARTSAGRVVLTLDGIEFEKNTGLYYEVYVNLPAGVAPDWQGPHFVGTMALFGLQPHGGAHADHAASAALTFDATAAIQRTGAGGGALSVTIVPRGPLAPSGKAAPIPADVSPVKIKRVLLSSE